MRDPLFGIRAPACEARRPSRGHDQSIDALSGGPARSARRKLGRGPAGGAIAGAKSVPAMIVIDFDETSYPFIACATGTALPVAMRAAAIPAA